LPAELLHPCYSLTYRSGTAQATRKDHAERCEHVSRARGSWANLGPPRTVAFYKKALFEGRVEDAFRLHAGPTYCYQHNPLIEDGMEGVKNFVT
jgi:hypothetical protein